MQKLSGYLVRIQKWLLRKKFHFDRWHISSLDQRQYAIDIIRHANRLLARTHCVEIGCGLGDIIRNLKFENRDGLDNDPKVLNAARFLNGFDSGKKIHFGLFQFPEDSLKGNFNLIIMVNWIHHIQPEILKEKIASFFEQNLLPNGELIIDTVQDQEYEFNHDVRQLINGLNCQLTKIGQYPRQREIWAIKKS